MESIIRLVITPSCDWGVYYFCSTISDKKFWEGHDYMCEAVQALALLYGAVYEVWEAEDDAECDGSTPDAFKDWVSITRTQVYMVAD